MTEYKFKKLSTVDTENDFVSQSSQHVIVEDGGEIKRLKNIPIPRASSEDAGKVLGVSYNGDYELQEQVILNDATLIVS